MIRSGTICLSLMYNYLKTKNGKNDTLDLNAKSAALKSIKETFQNCGGVFTKIAQMLYIESDSSDSKVYSNCKPINSEKTIEYLKKEFEKGKFSKIKSIDYNVYKSGSIGQVHKCTLIDGTEIILKVQYIGLKKQIDNDLILLQQVSNFLYSFADLSNALKDIKTKLNEELDYNIEYKNQTLIQDLWKDYDYIQIAKLLPGICTENIIGMHYLEGESFNDFILDSTQEEKNDIAFKLVKFIFINIYKHKIFYSDIHYGNFLITDKKILNVMDFGCINEISDNILKNFKLFNIALRNEDKELFYESLKSIGIIDDEISNESKEYSYEYFKIQYTPWISKHFQFDNDFLVKSLKKDTTLMREWKIPPLMVYLNKIPFGLFHILTKLNASGDFRTFFDDLIF